jgi:hypothetical protein
MPSNVCANNCLLSSRQAGWQVQDLQWLTVGPTVPVAATPVCMLAVSLYVAYLTYLALLVHCAGWHHHWQWCHVSLLRAQQAQPRSITTLSHQPWQRRRKWCRWDQNGKKTGFGTMCYRVRSVSTLASDRSLRPLSCTPSTTQAGRIHLVYQSMSCLSGCRSAACSWHAFMLLLCSPRPDALPLSYNTLYNVHHSKGRHVSTCPCALIH